MEPCPPKTSTASLNTNFCLQLAYKVLKKEIENGSNFVSSPLSIHVMLSLIAAGSTGHTLKQLLSFLGSESIHNLNLLSSEVISRIRLEDESGRGSVTGGPLLSFVNGSWVDQSFGLKPSFEEVVRHVYKGQAKEVDFITKSDEVTHEVNSWVENATNGLIKDLLPSGCLDSDTRLVLANALYFKGSWDRRFDPSKTENKDFHLLTGQTVQVPFMTCKKYEKYGYKSFDSFKILQIPYQSVHDQQKFSMYFFLPHEKDGLLNLLRKFNSKPAILNQDFGLWSEKIPNFWIPRFKFSFEFEASEKMKELGLILPFKHGELTEVSDSFERDKLYVSKIFHKACIEVNEEGTESAASSAATWILFCATDPVPSFVADHPFMFIIREETSKFVFFIGSVLNPFLLS
ncbi:Serpin-ZX like [Quillaja saponaria]|uniref:Serpin-ZX like n=1 Tax=Quillaja saponaria TaxID=32244 RepID=A0AAD7PXU5_QUISA|nr:Serpin-ZX like [Quillaja saponaria]